ncbi:N-acyl homoserine lactonase family protein [Streptomyces sp. NPDC057257]|uniref:N-acyl homoserine lactonase family protein n=1 Tax=Streptomyces sp. NPDC057257 TaxID=3346071 RepID=UPI003636CC63
MRDDEYEVIIARHGTRKGRKSEVFLSYGLYGDPDDHFTTDYYVWILRNAHRTVFVDTGFHPTAARRRDRTVIQPVEDLYASVNVDPAAGWPVIITHAHWDHIGNLQLFPASIFWLARAELDFWKDPVSRTELLSHFTEPDELDRLLALEPAGRLALFADTAEVAPGITVRRVGGHTPGQSVVSVRTRTGTVLLASDAAHFRTELESERPFAAVTDVPDMIRGFRLIKHLREHGDVSTVVTGHDPVNLFLGERVHPDLSILGSLPAPRRR